MSGHNTARRRAPEDTPSENGFKEFVAKRKYFAEQAEDDTNNAEVVAADLTDVEEGSRDEVLNADQLSKINSVAEPLPAAKREMFVRAVTREYAAALEEPEAPHLDQGTTSTVDVTLDTVKGDATLLRQWNVYQHLLTTVVLPPKGELFSSIEEAQAGRNLENTYRRARARQEKLGVDLVPKNDDYIKKVASIATLSYLKLKKPADLVA